MSWRALGASVTGTSHTQTGLPCQDAHAWSTAPILCIAASDGAGSRPMSHIGAEAAVCGAVDALSGLDWDQEADLVGVMRTVFAAARESMLARAASLELDVGDLAATLGVVIDTPVGRCVGQLGDGIVFMRSQGVVSVVTPSPRHEFANVTEFLSAPDWEEHCRFTDLTDTDIDAWILSTDGLRYKILQALDPPVAFQDFFADLLSFCSVEGSSSEAIARFLEGLENDQTGDDKTLVVAVRTQATSAELWV